MFLLKENNTNQFDQHYLEVQHQVQHLEGFFLHYYVMQLNDNYFEVISKDQHLKNMNKKKAFFILFFSQLLTTACR